MPSKNRLKTYIENGFYHLYNRGVAKQKIFLDNQDYNVFVKYLQEGLTTPKQGKIKFSIRGRSFKATPRVPKNFEREIILIAYCLMPNHFHILIQQRSKNSMESFMRSLITRYASFFNKKYERVGPVFQGRYKSALILKDEHLLHLSRYIHLNPKEYKDNLIEAHSSYAEYLDLRKTPWVKSDLIQKFFHTPIIDEIRKFNNYKDFVEKYSIDSTNVLAKLTID